MKTTKEKPLKVNMTDKELLTALIKPKQFLKKVSIDGTKRIKKSVR